MSDNIATDEGNLACYEARRYPEKLKQTSLKSKRKIKNTGTFLSVFDCTMEWDETIIFLGSMARMVVTTINGESDQ